MIVVTVARRPLGCTVAESVLKHETGALNIDAARVSTGPGEVVTSHTQSAAASHREGKVYLPFPGGLVTHQTAGQKLGRWPANLVLGHRPGCRAVGRTEVSSGGHWPRARPGGSDVSGPSGHSGQEGLVERHATGEAMTVWECVGGCPAADLDDQTGTLARQGSPKRRDTADSSFLGTGHGGAADSTFYGDEGGASRFFKQVGGSSR